MIKLGVNIDHVATLRQARGTEYPSPLQAAMSVMTSSADTLTLHLREDRRHIQDTDVIAIRDQINFPMNLEMAVTDEMIEFACRIKPTYVCLVPEKREELTTEGGLAVAEQLSKITNACKKLVAADIQVSLFIEPNPKQISAAAQTGASIIELHTGTYANAESAADISAEVARLVDASEFAHSEQLIVNAGHGLHYHNLKSIAGLPHLNELNIGHAIIAESIFLGLPSAISKMRSELDSLTSSTY